MKVFITRMIPETGLKKLKDAGLELMIWEEKKELPPEQLIKFCKESNALLSAGYNKIDTHFLKHKDTKCGEVKTGL